MTQLYAPFMAQAGQTMGSTLANVGQNKLIGNAYMGKPGAMEQLMRVNPAAGMQLQQKQKQQQQQAQQLELQKAAKLEAKQLRNRKLTIDNRGIIDAVVKDVAKFDDFGEASAYFERKKEENKPIFGDMFDGLSLTQEMYEEAKTLHGPKPEQVSSLDAARIAKLKAETGKISGGEGGVSALDAARIAKLEAETGKISAESDKLTRRKVKNTAQIDAITQDLTPKTKEKAVAAFELGGADEKGLKAMHAVIDRADEGDRRSFIERDLQARFQNKTPEEMAQLEAVVRAQGTVGRGFLQAEKLHAKQEQIKKGKIFQKRAVTILERILKNPELNDVLGPREGGKWPLRGANETNAISDIKEALSIVTSDNMDLMTGVLSESDIQILKELSGGALDRYRSEDLFIADVTELIRRLKGANFVKASQESTESGLSNDDLVTKYTKEDGG